jgi:TolB-like protein/DNA-binding winged helix-turn-helix (wHTH) protein
VATSPSLAIIRFGHFELDLRRGELRRSGLAVHLAPQPLKLLALLAARAGELISREEIRDQLWGAETFVDFEQGVNHCIRSIRTVLEDGARNPVYIETLPRRGYRFIGPVEVTAPRAASDLPAAGPPVPAAPADPVAPAGPRPLSAIAALARRLTLWLARVTDRPPWPRVRQARLAILPLENLTGDPQQACLGTGLTEEIRTQLSLARREGFHVVSSCSAKALSQSGHPVWAARQEGVNFLLGGSVRSAPDRVRVNVHLVRVRDETQVWAESYERPLGGDVLDLQTEIAGVVAQGVRARLGTRRRRRVDVKAGPRKSRTGSQADSRA